MPTQELRIDLETAKHDRQHKDTASFIVTYRAHFAVGSSGALRSHPIPLYCDHDLLGARSPWPRNTHLHKDYVSSDFTYVPQAQAVMPLGASR